MISEDFFESIQNHFNSELPFVVYRKPNEAEIKALLQNDDRFHSVKDFSETGFVFAPFDTDEDTVLIPFNQSNYITSSAVIPAWSLSEVEMNAGIHSITIKDSSEAKEHHTNLVKKAIEKINSGALDKVVVSRKESITLHETNPLNTFKRLLEAYPTAFVYCWYHPKVGLWLGASPETLLRVEGNQFTTMALAGTKDYNGDLDVVWGQKEKDEHQLVVDFIVDNLNAFCYEAKTFETETVKAGNILHLKTKIIGKFSVELKDILKELHPTPAVCGQPKEEAKEFILENENYKREFYTGFLGELNLIHKINRNPNRRNLENNAYSTVKKVSNLYVNLRCMQLRSEQAIIYVGGGITKDSIEEDEWEETVSKTKVMKKVLQ
ncbi:MAG TPA: chorismate-binding protein [Flavobacteriaceae bacterium]|nr:chorismate-binding protein [Flavobacteriaceae bacterium]